MKSGLTSHHQRGHTETGPRFKVSSKDRRSGGRSRDPWIGNLRVIHYTTAASNSIVRLNIGE